MTAVSSIQSQVETQLVSANGVWKSVGNTPLVRFHALTGHLPRTVEVYGKAEWFNPGGSVKDRPAAAILRQAIHAGHLDAGRTFLDSTSGNMGIAYATLGAALGLRVHLAIPGNAGQERLTILRSLGAELTLTDPLDGSDGARFVAAEMAAADPARFYYADQYANPANWQAHYQTTGPEIFRQTQGRITHFVAGLGTTGTMTGTGRYLREQVPDIRLLAVQPDGPLHGLEGLKHLPSSITPEIFEPELLDDTLSVRSEDAYSMARRLAREEGLLGGISAAAAVYAGLQVAQEIERGVIVILLPDSALKYLGQSFWGQPS
jgi:cysteine synthase B